MKREFVINIMLLFIINLMIKPLYIFGVEARIQDLTGANEYGLYFFYFNFIFLFQFINDPGIQNWNAQYLPKNRHDASIHISKLLQSKLLLGIVFLAVIGIVSMVAGYADFYLVIMIGVSFILSSLFMLLRTCISGMGYYKTDTALSSIDKVLMLLILGYLAWFSEYRFDFHISLLIIGQIIAYTVSCLIAFIIIFYRVSPTFELLKFNQIGTVIRSGAPFLLIMVLMTAYNKIDGVLLGSLLDDNNYQVGVYAAAYRFYDAANMTGYLFAALLLPMYASHIDNHNTIQELLQSGLKLSISVASVVIGIVMVFGENLLQLLYSDYQPDYLWTLRILIISYFMISVGYIYGTLILSTGNVKKLNVVFIVGLVLQIILCLLFIPYLRSVGAAIATLTTQIIVMIGQIYLVKKEFAIRIDSKEFYHCVYFGISSLVVLWLMSLNHYVEWYINLFFSILICVLLSFSFKILDYKDIVSYLAKK